MGERRSHRRGGDHAIDLRGWGGTLLKYGCDFAPSNISELRILVTLFHSRFYVIDSSSILPLVPFILGISLVVAYSSEFYNFAISFADASDCRPPSRSASNIAKSLSRDSSPVDVRGLSSARAPRSNQGPSNSEVE